MNKLKERRLQLSLTQREVADKIGIAYQVYQQYEYAKKLPNVALALIIAKALETTVEALWGD